MKGLKTNVSDAKLYLLSSIILLNLKTFVYYEGYSLINPEGNDIKYILSSCSSRSSWFKLILKYKKVC